MPIHDWTRVDAGIFYAFHHSWLCMLIDTLNGGLLPPDHYALIELRRPGPAIQPLGGPPLTEPKTHSTVRDEGAREPTPRYRIDAANTSYRRQTNRIVVRHEEGDVGVAVMEIVSPADKAAPFALRQFVHQSVDLIAGGVHLLVIDLTAPTRLVPNCIHTAIWKEYTGADSNLPDEEALTLASYRANGNVEAFVEPTHLGASLPDMPLFLFVNGYVSVPLESTYEIAFRAMPLRWRRVIEGRPR